MLSVEQELYSAWMAIEMMQSGTSDEEEGRILERSRLAYERAYDELGSVWTSRIIRKARTDAGNSI